MSNCYTSDPCISKPCPAPQLTTDDILFSGATDLCVDIGRPMTLTDVLAKIVTFEETRLFGSVSDSLVVTEIPTSCDRYNRIELVPSVDDGNILILGTDGHPYVNGSGFGVNIYNSNGSLTGNRILNGSDYTLNIENISSFEIDSNSFINLTATSAINLVAPEGISVGGSFGTNGYVLRTHGSGSTPTWDNPATLPIVSAANGLHINSTNEVYLGGTLIEDTTITSNNSRAFSIVRNTGFTESSPTHPSINSLNVGINFTQNGTDTRNTYSAFNATYTAAFPLNQILLSDSTHGAINGGVNFFTTKNVTGNSLVGVSTQLTTAADIGTGASGDLEGFIGVKINAPQQVVGLPFNYTGSIANLYGLYIVDTIPSNISGNIITRWGIYQEGSSDINYFAAKVQIGSATNHVSAALQVDSTTQGVLFPNMTTTQKNAISVPQSGLVVFDVTLSKLQCYDGATWNNLF